MRQGPALGPRGIRETRQVPNRALCPELIDTSAECASGKARRSGGATGPASEHRRWLRILHRAQNPLQIGEPEWFLEEGGWLIALRLVGMELPSGQSNRRNAAFGAVLTQDQA